MESAFRNSELTNILVVNNMKAALHFYIDQIEGELFREYGENSSVIKLLGNWILLVTPGGPTADKPNIHFKTTNNPDLVSHSFTIRVENCRESYEILRKRGVEFISAPYDWGMEVRCFFKDPDGHLFEISELKKSS